MGELQSELAEARAEAARRRAERARLADCAVAARRGQDGADAGRQASAQLALVERTCEKLKQKLDAAQYYKVSACSGIYPPPLTGVLRTPCCRA